MLQGRQLSGEGEGVDCRVSCTVPFRNKGQLGPGTSVPYIQGVGKGGRGGGVGRPPLFWGKFHTFPK